MNSAIVPIYVHVYQNLKCPPCNNFFKKKKKIQNIRNYCSSFRWYYFWRFSWKRFSIWFRTRSRIALFFPCRLLVRLYIIIDLYYKFNEPDCNFTSFYRIFTWIFTKLSQVQRTNCGPLNIFIFTYFTLFTPVNQFNPILYYDF